MSYTSEVRCAILNVHNDNVRQHNEIEEQDAGTVTEVQNLITVCMDTLIFLLYFIISQLYQKKDCPPLLLNQCRYSIYHA